jgi:peptide/nickel transport system substrate-binding protein
MCPTRRPLLHGPGASTTGGENRISIIPNCCNVKPSLSRELKNRMDNIGWLRFNHLHRPFSDGTIRRLVLACIDHQTFMEAVAGGQAELCRAIVGLCPPGTTMASEAGTEASKARTDFAAVKQELDAAGYDGGTIVFIAPSTVSLLHTEGLLTADLLRRTVFVGDFQEPDLVALVQRRIPPRAGGRHIAACQASRPRWHAAHRI